MARFETGQQIDPVLRANVWGEHVESMNKMLSFALIIAGVVLIVLGINAIHSFGSDVSRFFTGSPTDKSIWMLIGGIVLCGFGLFSVQQNWKSQ